MSQNDKKDHKGEKNPKVVYTRFPSPADREHIEEESRRHGGRPEYIRELVRRDRIAKGRKKK